MKLCQQCRKELTGKQRLFCSDACRKRHVRETSANGRELSNVQLFTVRVIVRFASTRPAQIWDDAMLHIFVRRRLADVIGKHLQVEYPDWQIKVVLDLKPEEKP